VSCFALARVFNCDCAIVGKFEDSSVTVELPCQLAMPFYDAKSCFCHSMYFINRTTCAIISFIYGFKPVGQEASFLFHPWSPIDCKPTREANTNNCSRPLMKWILRLRLVKNVDRHIKTFHLVILY